MRPLEPEVVSAHNGTLGTYSATVHWLPPKIMYMPEKAVCLFSPPRPRSEASWTSSNLFRHLAQCFHWTNLRISSAFVLLFFRSNFSRQLGS